MNKTVRISALLLLSLSIAPALFGAKGDFDRRFDPVGSITNGVDIWKTAGDGSSFMSFDEDPLPADFFCSGSEVFQGRVVLEGEPLATVPADAFQQADTVIERLDDAVFDPSGVATTRVRVRALSLVSVRPIETGCGLFDMAAHVVGEQPLTVMRIVQTQDDGGYLEAPLDLNVRMTFTRADRKASEALEVIMPISFSSARFLWNRQANPADIDRPGFVVLDTDGDSTPDTLVPGTSNFSPQPLPFNGIDPAFCQANPFECRCHNSGPDQHCVYF